MSMTALRLLAGAGAALTLVGSPVVAHAETPNDGAVSVASASSVKLGTQYGNVLRARLAENFDGSGGVISVYGSGNCTAATSDADISISVMPSGWNDVVSRIYDYASCDTKLYADGGLAVASYGYVNAGSVGISLHTVGWHDRTSSFRLS